MISMFTPEHDLLRKSVRAFVEKEVTPHVDRVGGGGADPAGVLAATGRARVPRPRVPAGVRWRGRRFRVERGAGRGDGALPIGRGGLQRARAHRHVLALAHPLRDGRPEGEVPARHHQGRHRVRARDHGAGDGIGHGGAVHPRGQATATTTGSPAARPSSPTASTATSTSSPRGRRRGRPDGVTTASPCSSSSAGCPASP